jgi:hypothetical protein
MTLETRRSAEHHTLAAHHHEQAARHHQVEIVGSLAFFLQLRLVGESQGYWTGSNALTGK